LGVMNTVWGTNRRAVLLALLFLFACSESFERTYKTRTEAEYDGAIAAGWVPSWLPQDAMEIREAHTLDTHAVMVRFSYPKERELKVPHSCSRIASSTAPPAPFERAWWPESVPEHEGSVERYAYHKCAELYVALLHSEGEGFVWSGMRALRGGARSGGNDAQPGAAADRPTAASPLSSGR
jgi:hypothetical protein